MNTFSGFAKRKRTAPWLMAGFVVILGLAVVLFSARNLQRTRAHMMANLLDHADALFWALEAGTRIGMGMHGGPGYFQSMVEETAKQHGIVYLAVTDEHGMILAHNDATRIGSNLHPQEFRDVIYPEEGRKGRFLTVDDGQEVFEVYKKFSPLPGVHPAMWCGPTAGFRHGGVGNGAKEEGPAIIFLGQDVRPFNSAMADELRTSAIIGVLTVLIGAGGFAALFWAEHYQRSRRLLKDTQAFASEVVTCLPLGLLTTNPEGRVMLANAAAATLIGKPVAEIEGGALAGLGSVNWGGLMAELEGRDEVLEREDVLAAPGGRVVPVGIAASRIVNSDGGYLGHLFLLRDLRELRRLQDQVRRNERLSALGNLAAGVAHEIRNPLSSIKGFATYLAGKVQGQDQEAARAMVQETDRLNRVVSELLEFARPNELKLHDEDLELVVERALRLAKADLAAKGIAVEFTRDGTLPSIPLDSERITQALLNLFLNAVQAMDQGDALRISTARDQAEGIVSLRIEDTGHGMPSEVLGDIFNPYFTTKPSGTGLGLAIVHRIIEGHGAAIKVESAVGRGTVFTIELPMTRRLA
jgi:two-component system sensor histidine kinase HydH